LQPPTQSALKFSGQRARPLRQHCSRIALAAILVLVPLQLLARDHDSATEDQVKAAYLFNFAKVGAWPLSALPNGSSSFVIGVSGADDDFIDVLQTLTAGKVIANHPVVVTRVSSEEDAKSCHIVFFRSPERKHALTDVEGLAQLGLLLVGEDDSFLRHGGMINLVREHASIHFEINPEALNGSQIHFSAKILALGKAGYDEAHNGSANSGSANSGSVDSRSVDSDSASKAPANPAAARAPLEEARRVERTILPDYPQIAARMKLTGTAQVSALVKRDGTVKEVRILGGHPLLADALVRAVRQWKYEPGPKETLEVVKFSFGP
jgi:TonB family protein